MRQPSQLKAITGPGQGVNQQRDTDLYGSVADGGAGGAAAAAAAADAATAVEASTPKKHDAPGTGAAWIQQGCRCVCGQHAGHLTHGLCMAG